MTPEEALTAYERALNTHDWANIAPLFAHEACCVFTEATFHGKTEIERAFRKTFALIEDERSVESGSREQRLSGRLISNGFWQGTTD